ncbi:Y' element ATP-dependent helicase YJL225C [Drosophila mauritiana]|uniref:Y' element ATP-dependent helicase YJL225C n=1 Tax=Drosophila mauritiana TaxID=7226 RepID=A0A6P8KM75_DROMA|nr:Y' element ATP-dependent helicase YJL225C [Drosophila mauritiana]
MTAFNRDHHFALLLIVALVGSSCILGFSEAQTFTAEDRSSIQKFMDSLLNFLELEVSNITTTLPPTSNGTTLETTTLAAPGNSTEVTTEVSQTSTNSTLSALDPTTSSLNATTVDSENTTATTTTTEANPTTMRRRICFKRFCYKFSNDKGYIV